jgi:hypothetical protein
MDKNLIHSSYRYGLYCAVGDEREIHEHCSTNGKIMHEAYVPTTKNNIQTELYTKQSANIHCSLQKELTFFLNHPPICAKDFILDSATKTLYECLTSQDC